MTGLALDREIRLLVVGIRGTFVVRHVAPAASCGSASESACRVAGDTGNRSVCASESKTGGSSVIEGGAEPSDGGVAGAAIAWESGGDVVRIVGAGKVACVAAEAIGGCALVAASGVARDAIHG